MSNGSAAGSAVGSERAPGAQPAPSAPSAQLAPAAQAAALGLAWVAGTALQLQQPALWPAPWPWGLAAGALCLSALGARWRQRWAGLATLLLAVAALAFACTSLRAAARLAQVLPPALEGQDLVLTGVVASLPVEDIRGVRFVFEPDQATLQGQPVAVPERISLAWYRGFDEDVLLGGPPLVFRAGERWSLPVRLRRPHGSFNPHGFDLELWLFEQGIGASGQVRDRPPAQARLLHPGSDWHLQRQRQNLRDAIRLRVPDADAAGVLAALSLGDQAAISRSDWDLFRQTGVAHLMSISGLHVTMLAWLAAALVGRLWRWHPRWPLVLPAPMAARWGGLLVAMAYALFAGWGVPAQRTVWMLATVVLIRSLGLRWPMPAVLGAAGLVVVVLDPWALLQPGFWLSFVAVGLLVVSEPVQATQSDGINEGIGQGLGQGWAGQASTPAAPRPASWLVLALLRLQRATQALWQAIKGGLRTQWVATIGLAPLTLVFFQQLSLVGFVANLAAIPLVTLVITPLSLLGVLLPPLWPLAAALVQGLSALLQALASVPFAVWTVAAAPTWAVVCGLLAGALAIAPLPWWLRVWALPLVLPLLVPPLQWPAHGQFEVVAADVGQGTAVLVRTSTHLLVYDAGPAYTPEADAGGRVLVPLLHGRGERKIDLLMLSHRDTDHVGGAATLMSALPVLALSSSLEPGHPLLAQQVPHTPCQAGQRWTWDGVAFEVLHPLAADLVADPWVSARPVRPVRPAKPNSLSCVLRVQAEGGASLLLTGDIEAAQEAALLQRAGPALRSSVMTAPHHGSRTSSTAAFLLAVQPQVAVVQAAYRSRFGHPAPEVLARYARREIQVVRTDLCGAWTWASQGGALGSGQCERQRAKRYWHHQGIVEALLDDHTGRAQ